MRKLIFALAAAGAMACAAPANAQTYYYATPFGWTTGFAPGWGYGYGWGRPAVAAYAAVPATRSYVAVRGRPVLRERRIVRRGNALGAYAYSPGMVAYGAPYVAVGFGFGPAYGWLYE